MNTPRILGFVTALAGLLLAVNSHGVAYTFNVTSGNWNTAANWSPTGVPVAADTVTIPTGRTVTGLGGASRACTSITIQGTGQLVVDNTLTVTATGSTTPVNIGNYQSSSANPAILTVTAAGTLNATSGSADTVRFDYTSVLNNNGTVTTSSSGQAFNLTGIVNQNAGATLNINNANGTPFGSSITLNISSSPNTISYGASAAQSLFANGSGGRNYYNLILSGSGIKTIASSTSIAANGIFSRQGTATNGGNNLTYGAGATLEYKGSTAQTVDTTREFPSSSGPANLIINNGSGVTLGAGRTINGTLTLTSGTLTLSSALTLGNGAHIIRTAGSLSTAPTFGTSVNVTYNNTSSTTTGPELPTSSSVLNNLTINNPAGVVLNANRTVNGTFSATYNGSTPPLAAGANNLVLTGSPVNITVTGSPLAAGNYTLISSTAASVSGTLGAVTVTGVGAPYSPAPTAAIVAGQLVLTIPPSTIATTMTLSSSANPAGYLSSVDLMATVTPATATGTVQFKTNGVALGSPLALDLDGKATLTTSSLLRGTHVVTAEYSGEANYSASIGTLSPNQVITNHPPAASHLTLGVAHGESTTLLVVGGKHAPTDVDGDSLEITAVGTASSGTAGFTATSVTYLADGTQGTHTFTYTVADGFGGTATRTVTVLVYAAQGFNRLSPPDIIGPGTVALSYLGIPGQKYALDHATSLTPPVAWSAVITNTAADNGRLNFTNSSAATENYFRTRHVP